MKPLRLAYVCSNPSYSLSSKAGYAIHIKSLLEAFSKRGANISVFMPQHIRKVNTAMADQIPKPHRLRQYFPKMIWSTAKDIRRIYQDIQFYSRVTKTLESEPVDIIYERLDYLGSRLPKMLDMNKYKYVVEIHAPLDEEQTLFNGDSLLAKQLLLNVKRSLFAAHSIVTVSDYMKQWLLKSGVSGEKICVSHNAVDINMFERSTQESPNVVNIGFVGSMAPWHRVDVLFKAFIEIYQKHPIHLTIAGPISADILKMQDLERLVNDKAISLLGSIKHEDIPSVLSRLSIGVMPGSNMYGSPIKIFEYGAAGLAVIAASTPAIREIITDGVDGILIESGNSHQLKNALEKLICDSELRKALSSNLNDKVCKNYTWAKTAQTILGHILKNEEV
ncbi:MAG: glycosyltransferase family 4 protein [Bdellovibrionales bacterium]|nr:glycosyltransferase family 4 protein [Bdellovibrionales bacterium]